MVRRRQARAVDRRRVDGPPTAAALARAESAGTRTARPAERSTHRPSVTTVHDSGESRARPNAAPEIASSRVVVRSTSGNYVPLISIGTPAAAYGDDSYLRTNPSRQSAKITIREPLVASITDVKSTFSAAVTTAMLFAAPLTSLAPSAVASSCAGYINVDDHCVASPDHSPGGYHDQDRTNSHSEHKQGSGSWHGGTGHSKK